MADWLKALQGRETVVTPVAKTKDTSQQPSTPTAHYVPPSLDSVSRCRAIVSLLAQDKPFRSCLKTREGASDYCAHHQKQARRQHFLRAVIPDGWQDLQRAAELHAPPKKKREVRSHAGRKYIQDVGSVAAKKREPLAEVPLEDLLDFGARADRAHREANGADKRAKKPRAPKKTTEYTRGFEYRGDWLPKFGRLNYFYGDGGERLFVQQIRDLIGVAPALERRALPRKKGPPISAPD